MAQDWCNTFLLLPVRKNTGYASTPLWDYFSVCRSGFTPNCRLILSKWSIGFFRLGGKRYFFIFSPLWFVVIPVLGILEHSPGPAGEAIGVAVFESAADHPEGLPAWSLQSRFRLTLAAWHIVYSPFAGAFRDWGKYVDAVLRFSWFK